MRPITLTQTQDGGGLRLRDEQKRSPLAMLKRDRSGGDRHLLEKAIVNCFPGWKPNAAQRGQVAMACGNADSFGPDDPNHLQRIEALQNTLREVLNQARVKPIIVIWDNHKPTFVGGDYNQITNGNFDSPIFVFAWEQNGRVCFDSLSVDTKSFPGIQPHAVLDAIADMHDENPNNPLLTYRHAHEKELTNMFTHGKKADAVRVGGEPSDGRQAVVDRQPILVSFEEDARTSDRMDDIELRAGMPVNSVRVLFRAGQSSGRASGVGAQGHAALILRDKDRFYHVSLYHQPGADGKKTKSGWLARCCREKQPLLFDSYYRQHRAEPVPGEEVESLIQGDDVRATDEFGGGLIFNDNFPEDKRHPTLVIELALPSTLRKRKLEKNKQLANEEKSKVRRGTSSADKRVAKLDQRIAAINNELAGIDDKIAQEMSWMVAYYKNYLKFNPGWVFCAPAANFFRLKWFRDPEICPDTVLYYCFPHQQNCATLARNILAAGGISTNIFYARGVYNKDAWMWLLKELLFELALIGIGFGIVVGLDKAFNQDRLNTGEEVGIAAAIIVLRLVALRLLSFLRDCASWYYAEVSFGALQEGLLAMAKDRSGKAEVVHTRRTLNSTVVITEQLAQAPAAPLAPAAASSSSSRAGSPGAGQGSYGAAAAGSPTPGRRLPHATSRTGLLDQSQPEPAVSGAGLGANPSTLAGATRAWQASSQGTGSGGRAPATLDG